MDQETCCRVRFVRSFLRRPALSYFKKLTCETFQRLFLMVFSWPSLEIMTHTIGGGGSIRLSR